MRPVDPGVEFIHQLATGVLRLDARLRVLSANPAVAELTGIGGARLLGQTLAALPPDGPRLHDLATRARDECSVHAACDVRVCAAPGCESRLDFTFSPAAAGVVVELHRATPAVDGARLSGSLRGFAHEIRNPLAAISGAAQLLQRDAATTRQRELAQLVQAEAERLAAMSEHLLGARHAMALRAVNVHAVLERVVELLAAEGAAATVERDYDPSLPAWQGDPDRLLQALLNLARNAVAAHARRLVLRSRAEAGWRDARGHRVPALRIEVDDDGDGVPDALAASLFEPMVSGRAGGSGLGLSLAREIAREHGGELAYQPRGRGSRFVLLLPRRANGEHAHE